MLAEHDLVPPLDHARTWQVFGGTVYFLVAAALFALGVGTLLRSSAGAITVALTVLLLLPGVLSFINLDWVQRIVDYLPLPASGSFLGGNEDSLSSAGSDLSPTTGLLVIAAYAVVPLAAGAWPSATGTPDRRGRTSHRARSVPDPRPAGRCRSRRLPRHRRRRSRLAGSGGRAMVGGDLTGNVRAPPLCGSADGAGLAAGRHEGQEGSTWSPSRTKSSS